VDVNDEVEKEADMGICVTGVDTGQNEDGVEVDGSTRAIGGGTTDDDGRCDGRGRGWGGR